MIVISLYISENVVIKTYQQVFPGWSPSRMFMKIPGTSTSASFFYFTGEQMAMMKEQKPYRRLNLP